MKWSGALFISIFLNMFLFFACITLYLFATTNSPERGMPYPFDDPHATYKIEKRDNNRNYVITAYYKSIAPPITYSYVANSKIDLAPYVGKTVKIEGSWPKYLYDVNSILWQLKQQCIQNHCHYLSSDKSTFTNVITIDNLILVQ